MADAGAEHACAPHLFFLDCMGIWSTNMYMFSRRLYCRCISAPYVLHATHRSSQSSPGNPVLPVSSSSPSPMGAWQCAHARVWGAPSRPPMPLSSACGDTPPATPCVWHCVHTAGASGSVCPAVLAPFSCPLKPLVRRCNAQLGGVGYPHRQQGTVHPAVWAPPASAALGARKAPGGAQVCPGDARARAVVPADDGGCRLCYCTAWGIGSNKHCALLGTDCAWPCGRPPSVPHVARQSECTDRLWQRENIGGRRPRSMSRMTSGGRRAATLPFPRRGCSAIARARLFSQSERGRIHVGNRRGMHVQYVFLSCQEVGS